MNVGKPKRGPGAPLLPDEVKTTSRSIIRLSDDEKDALAAYAKKNGVKMAEVLRDAIASFFASGEYPPVHLCVPEDRGSGPDRSNKMFVHMAPADKAHLDSYVATYQVIVARLFRYAIQKYIGR